MTSSLVVIRDVAKDVVTFSCPFSRFGFVPIGGRSTAIRLSDGNVWVLASTPLTEDTKAKLDELGPVKYIVGPDAVHYLFLSEYKGAYPMAKVIGVGASLQRTSDKNLEFDGAWGRDPPGTKYGFEDDIQHCHFTGTQNQEVAFFHPASKTMMEADLLFNLPCTEQYSKTKVSGQVPVIGSMGPSSWLHRMLTRGISRDTKAMKRDVATVAGWDFERIIPCHGDVIERDGKGAWRTAYQAFLP